MDAHGFLPRYFERLFEGFSKLTADELNSAHGMIVETVSAGGKLMIFGNGGSAAIASHVAVDFTKAAGVRAVNFNEADLITCFSNDYGYENWVAKAIDFYSDPPDTVILISSSGASPNILNGARAAKEAGLRLITLSGFDSGNALRVCGDVSLWCDSNHYNVVETTHQIWLLALVDFICKKGLL